LADSVRASEGLIVSERTGLKSAPGGFLLDVEGTSIKLGDGDRIDLAGYAALGARASGVVIDVRRDGAGVFGLKNAGQHTWNASGGDGSHYVVPPGRAMRIEAGTRIDFGPVAGSIRAAAAGAPSPAAPLQPFPFSPAVNATRSRRAVAPWIIGVVVLIIVAYFVFARSKTTDEATAPMPATPTSPSGPASFPACDHEQVVATVQELFAELAKRRNETLTARDVSNITEVSFANNVRTCQASISGSDNNTYSGSYMISGQNNSFFVNLSVSR
jgi:hypothetical protein